MELYGNEEQELYDLFRISVILKGLISAFEICGGLLFLLIPPTTVTALALFLTQDELSEDPNSFIANHVLHAAQNYSSHTAFIVGFYLLTRGVIKLGLVFALLKNRLWAYPASLAVLGLFVLYQIFDIVTQHSIIILGITLFDLIVIFFIWREYSVVRKHLNERRRAGHSKK
jgi:uncharacterized membrane protein